MVSVRCVPTSAQNILGWLDAACTTPFTAVSACDGAPSPKGFYVRETRGVIPACDLGHVVVQNVVDVYRATDPVAVTQAYSQEKDGCKPFTYVTDPKAPTYALAPVEPSELVTASVSAEQHGDLRVDVLRAPDGAQQNARVDGTGLHDTRRDVACATPLATTDTACGAPPVSGFRDASKCDGFELATAGATVSATNIHSRPTTGGACTAGAGWLGARSTW